MTKITKNISAFHSLILASLWSPTTFSTSNYRLWLTREPLQLIDEENKNVVGKRPRGRPKKIEGGNAVSQFLFKTIRPKQYMADKAEREKVAADRMAKKNTAVGSGFIGDYIRKKNKEWLARQPQPIIGGGKRGRPKGSKNKK